ncbi:MAG: formimidoylglutamase [Phycisphaerales bacterium]|nr:formimidoylglutamase [Phycisphaerales bacterium]
MPLPYLTKHTWDSKIPDTKFASRIQSNPEGCHIALIGLPDDTGVSLNNGRPGAKEGPEAFRAALASMGVAEPIDWDWPAVFDAGDVDIVPGDLHATHDRITQAVESVLELGLFPIAIGGGHDLTFPFVRAVASKHGPMTGVYFDPHLDVRETDGSGMPFRRLIETGSANALRIHGFDPMSNTRDHVQWFQSHGGRIDHTTRPSDPWPEAPTFVSLDLDVVDSAHAPGVSALNPEGWTPQTTARWAHAAGSNPNVQCFDIMELSPPHDQQNRTARFAARMFLTFLRGFTERST